MSWFKKLFGLSEWNPPITYKTHPPTPKVKANKNISEPVYSFIECVRKDPKRFVAQEQFNFTCDPIMIYTINDNKTKENWKIIISCGVVINKPNFITEEEAQYLVKEISYIYDNRLKRKEEILKKREERLTKKERQRLMEIYK